MKGFFEVSNDLVVSTHGRLTDVMLRLYSELDVIPPPEELKGYPEALVDLVELVYKGHGLKFMKFLEAKEAKPEYLQFPGSKKVVVGFSGGKDSLATALKCRKDGLEPTLFYVRGVNRSYPGEYERALKCAEETGMPLRVESVTNFGKSGYKENPVKDQLILAMMVDYGMKNGTHKFTMGLENTNRLATSNILYNWSDSVEMIEAGNAWIKSETPDFEWFWCVKNHSQSLLIICSENFDLLQHTISCLTPHRFQKMRREQILSKFPVDLLPNRCGTCWKCCAECLNLYAFSHFEEHEGFLKWCFEKFKRDLETAYCEGFGKGKTDRQILDIAIDPDLADNDYIAGILGIQ